MIYDVTLDEQTKRVEVVRDPSGWRVRFDGGPWKLYEARQRGGLWLVEDAGRRRRFGVALSGEQVQLVEEWRPRQGRVIDPRTQAFEADASAGAGVVRTAMPGVVVRIPVQVGDNVAEGDVLVVVEAMKMQNEFRAPKSGRVESLPVAMGESVAADTVLCTLSDPADAS